MRMTGATNIAAIATMPATRWARGPYIASQNTGSMTSGPKPDAAPPSEARSSPMTTK